MSKKINIFKYLILWAFIAKIMLSFRDFGQSHLVIGGIFVTAILLKNLKVIATNNVFFIHFCAVILVWGLAIVNSEGIKSLKLLLNEPLYLYTFSSLVVQAIILLFYNLVILYSNMKFLIVFENNRKTKPKHPVIIGRFGKELWREFLETDWMSDYEKDFTLELYVERGLFLEISENIYEWKTENSEEFDW